MRTDTHGKVWIAPVDWQPFETPLGNILDRLRDHHGQKAFDAAYGEAWFLPEQFAPETFEAYVLPVRAGLPIYLDGQFVTFKETAYLTMAIALEHHVRSLGQLGDVFASDREYVFDWQRFLSPEMDGKLRRGASTKIPADEVRKLFRYEPHSGVIQPVHDDGGWFCVGGGYLHIEFDYRGELLRVPAAHIAVVIQTGKWPHRVRYKNGPDDLSWTALEYDLSHDRSNFKWASGISFHKRDRLWRVHVPACSFSGRAGHQVSFRSETAAKAFRKQVERAVLLCTPMPRRPN